MNSWKRDKTTNSGSVTNLQHKRVIANLQVYAHKNMWHITIANIAVCGSVRSSGSFGVLFCFCNSFYAIVASTTRSLCFRFFLTRLLLRKCHLMRTLLNRRLCTPKSVLNFQECVKKWSWAYLRPLCFFLLLHTYICTNIHISAVIFLQHS